MNLKENQLIVAVYKGLISAFFGVKKAGLLALPLLWSLS
jgi:hypothetical protein